MIKFENDCRDCASGSYPCINCGAKHTPHFYCDKCGQENEKLYWHSGYQLCEDCIEQDLSRTVCEDCLEDEKELYSFEGENLCLKCVLERLNEVEKNDY